MISKSLTSTSLNFMQMALALAIIFIVVGPTTFAVSHRSREYQIKAAFLYNFGKLVGWPDESFRDQNAPMTYCVIGEDPFGIILDHALAGKSIGGREINLQRPTEKGRLDDCNILFISSSEQSRLGPIFGELGAASVLTVGDDMEGFTKRGGVINLITRGNKIRFEVNPGAATRSGLMLDFRLLMLAEILEP